MSPKMKSIIADRFVGCARACRVDAWTTRSPDKELKQTATGGSVTRKAAGIHDGCPRSLCVMLNSARRFSGGLFCTLLIATLLLAVAALAAQKKEQSGAPRTQNLFVTNNRRRLHYF